MNEQRILTKNKITIAILLLLAIITIIGYLLFAPKSAPNNQTTSDNNSEGFVGFNAETFTISDPVGKVVTISADTGYRNAAIKFIYDSGNNPAYYQIVFTNYENPFKQYE